MKTRATLEYIVDYPGGSEKKRITLELDYSHTTAILSTFEGCTDMIEALAKRNNGKVRISNSTGLIVRILDWGRSALGALRN